MKDEQETLSAFLSGGACSIPAAAEAAGKLYRTGKLRLDTQLALFARLRPMEGRPYLWGENVWPFFSFYFEGERPPEAIVAELRHLSEVAQGMINGKFHAGLSGNPAVDYLDCTDECQWL